MAAVADCFTRREPRLLAREMCEAMLMELDTRNCWTLAEALGHSGPHRLQHFLARARVDHNLARDRLAPADRSSAGSSSRRRCPTPASLQSRSRRQQVIPDPKPSSCGRYHHGMPVYSTNSRY